MRPSFPEASGFGGATTLRPSPRRTGTGKKDTGLPTFRGPGQSGRREASDGLPPKDRPGYFFAPTTALSNTWSTFQLSPKVPPPNRVRRVRLLMSPALTGGLAGRNSCTECVDPLPQLLPRLMFSRVMDLPDVSLRVTSALSLAFDPARRSSPPVLTVRVSWRIDL